MHNLLHEIVVFMQLTLNLSSYGIVSRNTSHCNFQLLIQIYFQIYNFVSNITNQNDDICLQKYNLFYAVEKHEICPFMETVLYVKFGF